MRWKGACYGGNGCDGKVLRCGAGERHQQSLVLLVEYLIIIYPFGVYCIIGGLVPCAIYD
jgi:hypothetical protein